MANSNFNVREVIAACKKMNTARRNILSALNNMKSTYGSVSLNLWSGATRQFFHKNVFGEDDNSGYIGKMGNNQGGLCWGLNELLYQLELYICNVYNKDAEYMSQYDPLNTNVFVDDSVSITPVTSWISYVSIDHNSVIISPEIIYSIESRFNTYCEQLEQNIDYFNAALTEIKQGGIFDDSILAIERVISALSSILIEFKGALARLLRNNASVAQTASNENQQASQANSAAAQILSQINFN